MSESDKESATVDSRVGGGKSNIFIRFPLMRLTPIKQHNTTENACLSPVSYHISYAVWILLIVPVLIMEEEGGKFASKKRTVGGMILRRYPSCEVFVSS